jgi:regulation of enolase protein 1 (concanavalin A-like superfamily)
MVRQNAANWMKCGTELVDGTRFASVVMTRDFSDWSTMPDLSKDAPVFWKAARMKDAVEVSCSLDGKKYQVIRQGYFPPDVPVNVGVMCASPVGVGFEAVFEGLKLTKKGK